MADVGLIRTPGGLVDEVGDEDRVVRLVGQTEPDDRIDGKRSPHRPDQILKVSEYRGTVNGGDHRRPAQQDDVPEHDQPPDVLPHCRNNAPAM